MFKIIKDGACIGMTENPNYIKQAENGCYTLCPTPEASGIAFEGAVYRLLGRDGMEGVETVMLEEVDSGPELFIATDALSDIDAMNIDHEYRLTLVSLGLAAADENN